MHKLPLIQMRNLLMGLSVLISGCHSSSGVPRASSPPFTLPSGLSVAKLLDVPPIFHEVKPSSLRTTTAEMYGQTALAFSISIPDNLEYVESKGLITLNDGGKLSIFAEKPKDPSTAKARVADIEKSMSAYSGPEEYVLKGPKFWGTTVTLRNAGGKSISAITSDGNAIRVVGIIGYPPGATPKFEDDINVMNTCIQSVKIHE